MNSLWVLEMEEDFGEREREGDCNVTSRDLGRNVCPLEEGFHINCFTKSVHKV